MSGVFKRVYQIVCAIPSGKVLTYGLISNLLEGALSAQGVGWALKALPSADAKSDNEELEYTSQSVPWHRVVNAQGMISTHKRPEIKPGLQKKLLKAEGVVFDSQDKIDLDKYLWQEAGSYLSL